MDGHHGLANAESDSTLPVAPYTASVTGMWASRGSASTASGACSSGLVHAQLAPSPAFQNRKLAFECLTLGLDGIVSGRFSYDRNLRYLP